MERNTKIILGITAAIVAGCAVLSFGSQDNPLETVPYVDLEKYAGRWYEISAFPHRFEKDCHCSMAEYKVKKNYVEVVNSCRKNSATGKLKVVKGKAFVADKQTNAKLKVKFFLIFKGDYWILDLAPDYSYTVVGSPDRNYLWILARQPVMDTVLHQEIVARIKDKGFDVSKLKMVDQHCSE